MMDLISVIVTVYNVEKYIERCLLSICNQSYKEIEIIVIDDGSTDNSGNICDRIAKVDKRICVVHQKNVGVSAARNKGILIARGKYIAFVDGDDYLDERMYDVLHRLAVENNAQMVICSFYYVYYNKIKKEKKHEKQNIYGKNEYLKLILRDSFSFYYSVVWNKLFCAEIIKKSGLRFDEELNIMEDFKFILKLLPFLDRLVVCSEPLYFYRKNNDSSLTKNNFSFEQSYKNRMLGVTWLRECVEQCEMDENQQYWITDYVIRYLALQFSKIINSKTKKNDMKLHIQISRREPIKEEMKNAPALFVLYRKVYWNFIYLWEKLLESLRHLKNMGKK